MANERIFELIRKEEVVLFAGAGMSIYAGYPSGATLCQILYDNLSDDIKPDIEFTYNLPKLCDDIFQLKGGNKNYLVEVLKKEFKKTPVSTETHKLLAGIPHFRTIITTNYDTLIESENSAIEVIRKSTDYANVNPKDQLLFKIHSDFTDIEKIILTSSDYLNYFTKQSENTIFWNAVKDRLASNHILFVGYSLDDTNVQDMIKKIIDELGVHRKEIYFASPSLPRVKQAFLQRHNIFHIQSTGENLIKEIDVDIKRNYFPDLSKGIGTADTALNVANSNQFSLELSKKSNGFKIGQIKSLDSRNDYKFDFKVELPANDSGKFIDFINNKSFDDLDLDASMLKEFSFYFKDFRIRNEDSISKITLQKKPNFDCNINIVFDADDFEVDNYPFKFSVIKPSEYETRIKILIDDFTLLITLNFNVDAGKSRFNMDKNPPTYIKSTNSGLQFYQILSRITSNQKFKIYKEGKLFFSSSQFILPFTQDAFNANGLRDYFIDLKKIEKHFNVKFTKIDLQNAFENRVKLILLWMNNETIMHQFDTINVKCDNESEIEILENARTEEKALIMSDREKTIISLHGHEFDLGYRFQVIYDTVILNPESLENYKSSKIIVGSKTNMIRTMFSKDGVLPIL